MNDRRIVPKKRRKIKVSHVLIALLLAAVAAFAIFRLNTRFKLKARIDAIRAAGYPVTCDELDQWYKIPRDAENAAYTLEEAFSYFTDWDKEEAKSLPVIGSAELPPGTEPLPAEMKTLIAEFIADYNEPIELFHVAAEIEHCRYPVDLNAAFSTLMPNLSEMRKSVQLLKLDAILHAETGDAESARRSVISSFGIARSLAGMPMTICQLVRVACQSLAISTIEQVVNRTQLTDEQLADLVECIRDAQRISGVSCGLVGERCMGMSFFQAPESVGPDFFGGGGGVIARPVLAIYRAVGLADADAVTYLELMDGYFKSTELPMHRRQEAADAVMAKLEAISGARVLLQQIMPAYSRIVTLDMKAMAHLRAADAGLAVQRYRLAADKLPDKLTDLVPAYLESVPKDPFDGNDLRYKKLEPGFVVYSIGEDLSDDGGKERQRKKERGKKLPNWDVTFIVER